MTKASLEQLYFVGRRTLPLIRQAETTECGNACLAMIASFHGHRTDIASLRRRFPTSARGVTLRLLAENAGRIGFASRALRLELKQLNRVQLPAILHWDLNHFVVLKSIGRGKAVIHDPAKGALTMSLEELSEHFTGIVLELTPTSQFEQQDERIRLKMSSLWSRLRGLGGAIAQTLLLSVVIQVYVIGAPQYLQIVVDTVLPSFDLNLLLTLAIGFALFLLVNVVAVVIRHLVILFAGSAMSYQISINLFSQLIRLPLPFFERRQVGDLVSRFESIEPIKQFLTGGLVLGIVDGLMAIVTLALMFAYSPTLAVISLSALILYLILRLMMFRSLRRASEELIITGAIENTNFIETVRGILAIKSFSQEESRKQRWQNYLADSVNQSVRVKRLDIVFDAASQLISGIENVIVIYLAAMMVMDAEFTIGMIFAFMAYRGQFVNKAVGLVELLIQFRMLELHLDRISDIAMATPEPADGELLTIYQGRIEVRNLRFAYEPELPSVFKDANFIIEPGESVALVGPSGGGKTTLLKLMMGLMQPNKGEILIDGAPLARANPAYYRSQIASVMQDDLLFAGSLTENITFFDLDPDLEWARRCAEMADIHEEITQMAMGYETPVGDMGSTLSGGQVQRVLLARALYRRPRILFVDEATSNLDVKTERKVNEAISALGITRVMSAHRPETIRSADRIIVVASGSVTEAPSDDNLTSD
ncbi:peptidase domain-containing ABC transporter [Pontivivens insulae]|uniref:Toxin RTX-I translocation ATP-binding protein n=1 Tax=Pontivivens insulae TaxID=1639689 RepID=A0A2R8AFX2_9RHOB|nr:peptidase domain-containing ABC transporter [Pontivivens insulae]RED10695.1 colicin V processing peptidase [Pontivivens insulae]SPF31086.1 Toxin RTX-I translocation ATP-binding protein [Pontivivens insulae]